ncbi:hypothetical protein ACFL5P_03175 [candidate division KSB1 bacterium]
MCFFFSFIPATFWVTIGYFIYFTSTRTEDSVKKFGQILAYWTFFVALCFIICGAYVTFADKCPLDKLMGQM